jgi:hypothetical protein
VEAKQVGGNVKCLVRSCFDRNADHQHTLESRRLHLADMKRRPAFDGEYDLAREAERRLCEDEISHALFCVANEANRKMIHERE